MATTTPPAITALPAAPDPNNRATFNTLAYPWSAALPGFGTQVSAVADNVKANADDCKTNADIAVAQVPLAIAQVALATTQADLATTEADTATTQAGIATTQAASVLSMDKRYLGSKVLEPALDNQGDALEAGAVYFNSTTTKVMTYTGSVWVEGITGGAGVASVNGLSGVVSIQTVPDFMFMSLGVI